MRRFAREVRGAPWWLWVIAAVALALRLASLSYGLPYELNADERFFVTAAWEMVEDGDWDPEWHGFPAATLYVVLSPLYALYGWIGIAVGAFEAWADVGDAYLADGTHFFMLGRLVTALAGTFVVLATYALARESRTSQLWAGVAALAIAISWPILELSTETRGDMPQVLALLILLLIVLRAITQGSGRLFAWSGVFLGLAAVSKYPAVIGAVPILLGVRAVVAEGRATARQGLRWLTAAACAGLLAAFLAAPYLFINPLETVYWVLVEVARQHIHATSGGIIEHLRRYVLEALPAALGWLGATVGIAGLVAMLRSRRTAVVTVTAIAYVLFISVLSHWWARWLAPMVPVVAVGIAYGATALEARFDRLGSDAWVRSLARCWHCSSLFHWRCPPSRTQTREWHRTILACRRRSGWSRTHRPARRCWSTATPCT